jgi:hypothetical protein
MGFLVQSPLGHMGVLVPRDTSPGIRWRVRARQRLRARSPLNPRAGGMRSRSIGVDHSIDFANHISSAIEPGRPLGAGRVTVLLVERIDAWITKNRPGIVAMPTVPPATSDEAAGPFG